MGDVATLLREASARVEPADAALLVAHALGRTRTWLYAHGDEAVEDAARQACERLLARREAGEPVAYLTGRRGFWRFDLHVTPDTLVPRPETELLVELALERLPEGHLSRIADLGTGSGAIALALAHERTSSHVVAVDASAAALEVARGNARELGIGNVEFREGDWLAPLAGERFDLIASNPPYIASEVIPTLSAEVRREPRIALDGGRDGLAFYDRICGHARDHLVPGGALVVEHGFDQAEPVRARFEQAGFTRVTLVHDLGKQPRVTWGLAP